MPVTTASDPIAYKVMTSDELAAFRRTGLYPGSEADSADGYIHMSTASQLDATLAKHYAGRTGLVIVTIDLLQLGDALRWEPSRGGALFPHLYAALPIGAVIATRPVEHAADPTAPGAER